MQRCRHLPCNRPANKADPETETRLGSLAHYLGAGDRECQLTHGQGALGSPPVTADADFLQNLVGRFSRLEEDYACHVENNGSPLPHVFFWDVTQAVMHAYNGTDAYYGDLDWRELLQFLEETYPTAPLNVKEVLVTSFLLNLPWPAEPGYAIVAELGPALAERFRQVRPAG